VMKGEFLEDQLMVDISIGYVLYGGIHPCWVLYVSPGLLDM
jgi:hypothetical protein